MLKGEESFPKLQCFVTLKMTYKIHVNKIPFLLSDPTDQVPVLNYALHQLQTSIVNLKSSHLDYWHLLQIYTTKEGASMSHKPGRFENIGFKSTFKSRYTKCFNSCSSHPMQTRNLHFQTRFVKNPMSNTTQPSCLLVNSKMCLQTQYFGIYHW